MLCKRVLYAAVEMEKLGWMTDEKYALVLELFLAL